jgi:hypothetical protein
MGGTSEIASWLLVVGPAVLAAAAALAGVVLTNRTIQRGWRRDEDREYRQWLRDQRLASYVGVFDAFDQQLWTAFEKRESDPNWRPDRSWFRPIDLAVTRVKLLSGREIADLAEDAMKAFVDNEARPDPDLLLLLKTTLEASRADLRIERWHPELPDTNRPH